MPDEDFTGGYTDNAGPLFSLGPLPGALEPIGVPDLEDVDDDDDDVLATGLSAENYVPQESALALPNLSSVIADVRILRVCIQRLMTRTKGGRR